MVDRRKEMWKLLYNVVSRENTGLLEIFSCVDDILCNELSLLGQFSEMSVNKFQDTLILWLVNQLLRALNLPTPQHVQTSKEIELVEGNLNIQCKLLTSCLNNRQELFKYLIINYNSILDQLVMYRDITQGVRTNLLESENEGNTIEITAITSKNLGLEEMDNCFTFKAIQLNAAKIDYYIEFILQILNHALSTGKALHTDIFADNLILIFKIIRNCQLTTKAFALEYVKRLFESTKNINRRVIYFYKLSWKALKFLYQHIPFWSDNSTPIDQIQRILVLSKDILSELGKIHPLLLSVPIKNLIIECGMTSLQYIFNIHAYNELFINTSSLSTDCLRANLMHLVKALYCILSYYPERISALEEMNCGDTMKCVAQVHPIVMRLMVLYVEQHPHRITTDRIICVQFIIAQIQQFFKVSLPEICEEDYVIGQESLIALTQLEYLHLKRKQKRLRDYLKLNRIDQSILNDEDIGMDISDLFEDIATVSLRNSIEEWIQNYLTFSRKNRANRTTAVWLQQLKIIGLLLHSRHISYLLSHQYCNVLWQQIVQPLTCKYLYNGKEEELELLRVALESIHYSIFNHKNTQKCQLKFAINTYILINTARELYNHSASAYDNHKHLLLEILQQFTVMGWLSLNEFLQSLRSILLKNTDLFITYLKLKCCYDENYGRYLITKELTADSFNQSIFAYQMEFSCRECFNKFQKVKKSSTELNVPVPRQFNGIIEVYRFHKRKQTHYLELEKDLQTILWRKLWIDDKFTFITNHWKFCNFEFHDYLQPFYTMEKVTDICIPTLRAIIREMQQFTPPINRKPLIDVFEHIFAAVQKSLNCSESKTIQSQLLEIVMECSTNDSLRGSKNMIFYHFKMLLYYLVHPASKVVPQTILFLNRMCNFHQLEPMQLWNWYKRDILDHIVQIVTKVYLSNGIELTKTLKTFSDALGFSCVEEFICKYHRLLVSMLMPYCFKYPACKGLIKSISRITQKPISQLLSASFLRTYAHVRITENMEIGNACIEMIGRYSGNTVRNLMNADVKQTVSGFLVYFHRSPQFVLQAFEFLFLKHEKPETADHSMQLAISKVSNSFTKSQIDVFANFIADHFLGVLTYFQSCLAEPNFNRKLKVESLKSLGEIMRLIGSINVTQFRFKIIAMLTFVLNINEVNLQKICLRIWNVFLHTVNIEELGTILNRIVASLQPLLETYNEEINNIYEYLILQNESLLGHFISDLYFLENDHNVREDIRKCIIKRIQSIKNDRTSILEKLHFYHKHITNDNLEVRVHGLKHLRKFVVQHRLEINSLILDVICEDRVLEEILNDLVAGCRHEDHRLNMAAAKCLGEFGAIDPSYLSSSRTSLKINTIPLNIYTDEFASKALIELCRAYEFQKDTKYVDNFSLAIQETLSTFDICPKEKKKLEIWNTIPKQMQQVIEPFLTSFYTINKAEKKYNEHPLFNSGICNSFEEWSTIWSCRLIDLIQHEETNHLLNSYKPSIRRSNRLLTLFFPYILLHALFESKNDVIQYIYEEFKSVFDSSVTKEVNSLKPASIMLNSTNKDSNMDPSSSNNNVSPNSNNNVEEQAFWRLCVEHCSEQIDFLQHWLRGWQSTHLVGDHETVMATSYKIIEEFVYKFSKLQIAQANYQAGEYVRSLVYLEEYICEIGKDSTVTINSRLQEHISFLIKIHGKLSDADSVQGAVYLKKSSLTLSEEILVNRLTDRPQDTMSCYEQLLASDEPLTYDNIRGIVDCYLSLDTPETALLMAKGLWKKVSKQCNVSEEDFRECTSEVLWRLGRFDDLEEILPSDSITHRRNDNWSIQCAEACLLFRKENTCDNFQSLMDEIRSNVVRNLHSTSLIGSECSYENYYVETVRLHLLDDVEKIKRFYIDLIDLIHADMIHLDECREEVNNFIRNWDARIRVLQPTVRILEPVFACRRNLLLETERLLQEQSQLAKDPSHKSLICSVHDLIHEEVGRLWLRSAQMYREARCLQQAQLSLMKADQYKSPLLFLEKSKLMWLKGDQRYTFKLLEENIERMESLCSNNVKELSDDQQSIYSEAKFLLASYNAESMNICSESNLRCFKEALICEKSTAQCYTHLAQYMEKIYDSLNNDEKEGESGCTLLLDIVINYAKSLRSSFTNVYQSLPRLLSIWLDFTAKVANSTKECATSSTDRRLQMQVERSRKMNDIIHHCQRLLPISIFYTTLSQLLSRLCHPSNDVYNNLKLIIIKLLEHYPQQCLWTLLPYYKSGHTMRAKRCFMIFNDPRLNNLPFQKLLNDFNMLTERLIELTNKEDVCDSNCQLSNLVKQLPRMLRDPGFSQIMLPFEKYMHAQFPMNKTTMLNSSSTGRMNAQSSTINMESLYNPIGADSDNPNVKNSSTFSVFPHNAIYIKKICEKVTVIRSAAKPKKIVVQCSDGIYYNLMLKPKDDLRKDYRLMEFNALVKRYLHQNPEARHRGLTIRTYAVVPLNETCGLVEWLPNLNSFRNICQSIYQARGLGVPDRMIRKYMLPKTDPIEKKRNLFTDILLPKHPPVFQLWFRQQFPTAQTWYLARSNYIKTLSVMSMVGYILGLGDRHGENILFDQSNGDAVHVDFNCLFNLGETFPYPELVPFRLTHNMIAAMGPLGVEGPFRCCCEISLRVLKDATKTLVSVLTPFFYDLAFSKRGASCGGQLNSVSNKSVASAQEVTDPKAILDVKRIERRLKGYVKNSVAGSIPLSVEGQVNFLIKEATNLDNLVEMYIGWGAYI